MGLATLSCALLMPAACTPQATEQQGVPKPVVTHTSSVLLEGTKWETAVHKYVVDKPGPKIAIVGGIHGDEKAGWTAGLELVEKFNADMKGICGEILLIPQANIVADKAVNRYPGISTAVNGVATYDGVQYSDLNRSFPDGRAAEATVATVTVSDAVRLAVEGFNPDYVIDLHESLHSYAESNSKNLGDTLIFKNKALFMSELLDYYNKQYKADGDYDFTSNPSSTAGSFNLYFTNLYKGKVVFTVETNRGNKNGVDTIDLKKRVTQQLNILNALFDMAWEIVDVSKL